MDVAGETRAQSEEAKRSQWRLVITEIKPVSSQLLDDKLVKRLVIIQRADDIITICPGPGESLLLEKHISLVVGVAGDVEPVACPMLAVARGFQQPINFGFRIIKFRFLLRRQPS